MSETNLEETITRAVKAAIEKELGSYKVDKEQHYQDHLWLKDLREWYSDIRSSFWKSLVAALVPALLLILFLGFVAWTGLKTAIGVGK